MCSHQSRVSRGFEETRTYKILSETGPKDAQGVHGCPISWIFLALLMLHSAEAKLLIERRQARITVLPCHADQRSEVFCFARP